MIAAPGSGLNPYAVFAAGLFSAALYEHALYGFGRYIRNANVVPMNRITRYILNAAQAVNALLHRRPVLWLIFGRFLAVAGLYIPFGAGQQGMRYAPFLLWTTIGNLLQFGAFGLLAYKLGDLFSSQIQKWGLVSFAAAFLLILAALRILDRLRRRRKSSNAAS